MTRDQRAPRSAPRPGETSVDPRARVPGDALYLDVALDPVANQAGGPRISAARSQVSVWVIATNERCEKATELPQAAVQAECEALLARMGGRPIVPNIKV